MFWIVEISDGAILGLVSGQRTQHTIDGPLDSYEDALTAQRSYSRYGCTYYAIRESDERPQDTRKEYEFVDAPREFDDVPGW